MELGEAEGCKCVCRAGGSPREKQRFGYFQQLAVSPFPERRFLTPGTLGCVRVLPCGAARSSEARTGSPVCSEVIQLKLSSFSIRLSVKFTSAAGKQQLAGSRRVCTSCRGARLTTTLLSGASLHRNEGILSENSKRTQVPP